MANKKNKNYWSEEKVYDEKIYPLMNEIIKICKENKIPLVATFQYGNAESGPQFCNTILVREGHDEHIDNLINLIRARRANVSYSLAETIVTNPDGTKEITIKRV